MAFGVRRPEDGPGQADDLMVGVANDLELENQRLRKAVSDLTFDKPILSEAAKGPEGRRQPNFSAPCVAAPALTM
jgi:hypothetical protein